MTDFDAIQNLVVAERMYRVSHRNKELAECYAPDASIHTSWQNGGVSSFVGKEPAEAQKSLPIVNRCNPPLIRINQTSDRAVVEYPMTTIRELITRMLAGGQISQDLEGTDRPESVQQIYDAADSWLNNE